MKILARELGFFFVFSLAALCLTPAVVDALALTSEAWTVNRLERIFLVQIAVLAFLAILAALYVLRLALALLLSTRGGGGGMKP